MVELKSDAKAFSTFRVLNGDADASERDQLFRNMAQLFSHVSDQCDDDQVAQYDEVLCQLADLVEAEARAHVSQILCKLDRAPGSVVVKLAHDTIDVAQPLLEFSNVLSDDDLIEIIHSTDEEHRVVIASRDQVNERVGDAIVDQGGRESVVRLVQNKTARIGDAALGKIAERAANDSALAGDLRGRDDIDWARVSSTVAASGGKVLEQLGLLETSSDATLGSVSAVVYNRLRNSAGFSAREWKLSWNQVKALADRRKLDEHALSRFSRFGYGHHAAVGLTMMLHVSPSVFVKWLAAQDYLAITVACRAQDLPGELFENIVSVLPWRDLPTAEDIRKVRTHFDMLSHEEAREIFSLWRAHEFRKGTSSDEKRAAGAA